MQDDLSLGHYLDQQFASTLKKAFPWIEIDRQGQAGPDFFASMPEGNNCLRNSEYYYTKSNEFFHVTDVPAILSILNGQSIRLYNLHSSIDKEEYLYGANLLGLSPVDIQLGKKNVFTFSFCPISELNNRRIWDAHSKDFSRAAIIFTIENDISKWEKYHIAEVKYERPTNFEVYKTERIALEKEHGVTFGINLNPLIPFHKQKAWNFEKEVRLIANFPFKDGYNSFKYVKPDFRIEFGRNRVTEYIEFPLFTEPDSPSFLRTLKDEYLTTRKTFDEKTFETIPKIKIKNILIGKNYGIRYDEYFQYKQALEQIIRMNLGYHVELSSNLFSC